MHHVFPLLAGFLLASTLPAAAQSQWAVFENRFEHAVASDTNIALGFGGRPDSNPQSGLSDVWSTVQLPWAPQPTSGSPDGGRYLHAMAAIGNGVFVSFGGYRSRPNQPRDLPPETGIVSPPDEIIFGVPTVTPSPRFGHTMVRDVANSRVILFGGDTGGSQSFQTWSYTRPSTGLGTWTDLTNPGPGAHPPGRSLHSMAYDEVRGRMLMFGGTGGVADTWEFDCATNQWTQLSTPPQLQARTGAALQYSPGAGHFVLFGGLDTNSQLLSDTWVWSAAGGWALRTPATTPPPRSGHAMTWTGSPNRQVLMVGGKSALGFPTGESWLWNGINWIRPVAPESRYFGAMADDTRRGKLVLFGGARNSNDTLLDDTWELDSNGWKQWQPDPLQCPTPPPLGARHGHAMAYADGLNATVMFGGTLGNGSRSAELWHFLGTGCGWRLQTPTGQTPPPTSNMGMAYHAARGVVVMFGGVSDGTGIHNDTWTWNGSTWAQVPSGTVPPRSHGLMAYDASRHTVVLFGGHNGTQILTDTWEWDGTWIDRTPAQAMPPLLWSHMAYDSFRARTVLFGGMGFNNGCPLTVDNTYEWDGSTWLNRNNLNSYASPRAGAQMAYDSRRESVVLFSGFFRAPCGSSYVGVADQWEYRTLSRASFLRSGQGCLDGSFQPALDTRFPGQVPWIGSTFDLRVQGMPPASVAFIELGVGTLDLPIDPNGCRLYVTPDIGPFVAPGNPGAFPISIPNQISLVGAGAFLQAFVLNLVNSRLTSSDRGELRFGAR